MARLEPAFLVGEFAEPEPMLEAATDAARGRLAGGADTPFPVKGMKEALGFHEPHRAARVRDRRHRRRGRQALLQAYANWAIPARHRRAAADRRARVHDDRVRAMVLGIGAHAGMATMFVRTACRGCTIRCSTPSDFTSPATTAFSSRWRSRAPSEGGRAADARGSGAYRSSKVGGELPE